MKHLLAVILAVVGLVAVVTGCGGSPSYDARLVAADSLMHDLPDSALALVQAVDTASLPREGDRAYRDLLLTQARYRCYITATSDSDINRALGYYRQHDGEREKLTRAYIYKGAVMEELGHPDSAMLYYKHAEATAAPTDYFNLGYTKMRMGALYTEYYDLNGIDILKYEDALKLFTHINDEENIYICLNNLGCLYRESQPQKAEKLLKKALNISMRAKDTAHLVEDYHALMVLYYYDNQNDKALETAIKVAELQHRDLSFEFYTSAANVYARAGLVDSAVSSLNKACEFNYQGNDEYRLFILESLCEIALAKHDIKSHQYYLQQSKHLSDSLITNPTKMKITESEDIANKRQNVSLNRNYLSVKKIIVCILFVASLLLISLTLLYHFRANRYRFIINQLKHEASDQLANLDAIKWKIS